MSPSGSGRGDTRDGAPSAFAVMDEIAAAVLLLEPSDGEGLRRLRDLFTQLQTALKDPPARELAARSLDALDAAGRGGDPARALESVIEMATQLQAMIAPSARAAGKAPAGTPGLSDPSDEKLLKEFAAGQRAALEEMEGQILAMERGDTEQRATFRRKLHTLKGEAGVLGLVELERVCHALEDHLESVGTSPENTDRLLKVRDWMVRAIDRTLGRELPSPRAEEVIAGLAAPTPPHTPPSPAEGKDGGEEAKPGTQGAPLPQASARVERDAETVALFGDFLQESAEGLSRVDQILMNVEKDGVTADSVNALFRVFHTIKGTAGFLELTYIVQLAHTTEAMLNRCRQGELQLTGTVTDLAFDATTAMRRMLEQVKAAVESGQEIAGADGLADLVRSIEVATEGGHVPEKEIPVVQPGAKLGEVIVQPPISVPPKAVDHALAAQATTGRRLGEELVAEGAAEPSQVAHALRAQARAEGGVAPEAGVKLRETIKVDLERVDSLVEMIGELVVVEAMVVNSPEIAQNASFQVRNFLGQLAKVTRDLQDVGMRMRMVPVSGVFQKMARLVRDLSRKSGKPARLVLSGETAEMDRSMVEQIADPLVHLIRNAMDHGLETPEERARTDKPPEAVVRLSAYHEGGSIIIEVADDGRGLDREAILEKALAQGLISSADGLSDTEVNALIFAPGFSTAKKVTEISGRGVGMDVVKRNIETLRGRVITTSKPGQGTTFKLVLPLTLAIIDGMLVACGEERYIIPTLSIIESVQPDSSMLVSLTGKNEMINLRGQILPLLRLDRLFELPGAKTDPTQALVVILEGFGRRLGLLVDEVVAQQQVVIKTLGSGISKTPFVSGAAILADGRVGLILNVEEIANLTHYRAQAALLQGGSGAGAAPIIHSPPAQASGEEVHT